MDFVTPIITPIVKSLLVPIKRHLGFMISSTNYVSEMHEKLTELDGLSHDMHTQQVSNKVNSLVVSHRVPGWLADVDKIKAKVERFPKDGVGCFNVKMRYKTGKQSCDIIKAINRLVEEKAAMVWNNEKIPLAMVTSPRLSIVDDDKYEHNENRIESRELIFSDALKSLEPNNTTRKMALCGMAGVGKTTMMEQLKKVAKDRRMFDWIVKVDVGQNPNPVIVQQTVAEYIGEPLTETTKDTRAERLRNKLEGMSEAGKKKILVILDDVWEEFNLRDIGLTSPLPYGFKLLLTSRDESVCTQMGIDASSIFRIVVFSDLEAKKLFWETTGLFSESNIETDLHQIGEDIVKRCSGLPIAIKTIASTLRDNNEKDEWEDALSRLRNKTCDDYNIRAIFEISYKNIKEDDLRAIFILCGLFPDDYNIGKEDLLRYGWGLKFFQNVHTIAKARSRVNTCVNKLIRSNLLIKSDQEGCVKMHDLIRDFVLSNFSKVKQASIVNHDNNVSEQLKEDESYERILLKCRSMTEFPVVFNHPNLALLKLIDGDKNLKFPKDFYKGMENLEVVAYENMHRVLLPRYSTNLQALFVHSCSLGDDDTSFIGDLVNLEVLSLTYCGISKLPSKMGKLKRLKLLDLTGCTNLCIDDGVFKNMEKLEELYMGVSGRSAIRFTDANYDELVMLLSSKLSALEVELVENYVQPKHASFEKLERFRISIGCLLAKDKIGWDYSDVYSFKNTLKLVTSSSVLLECKINHLFRKTELLYLEVNDMYRLEDVLSRPQHSFRNLKALGISDCACLTYLFTIRLAKSLTKLERLEIQSCPALKFVVNGDNSETEVISFRKLEILSLHNLPELVSLCDPVNAVELPQLIVLDLDCLPNFTSIFSENIINVYEKQTFFSKEVVIPKLERLILQRMENLKEIWPCEIRSSEREVNNMSMLEEIEVTDCNSLVNIFPTNPIGLLCHLEEVAVESCCSIEVLFNVDMGKTEQLKYTNLRSIGVWRCDSFREVWRIKEAENNYSNRLVSGFQAIESIVISECERFRNIVTPTTVSFDMRALKDIHISCITQFGGRNNESDKNSQEQEGDNMSIFASFPCTQSFNRLRKVEFNAFEGASVVFWIEVPSNRHDQLVTTQQQQLMLPLLPYLEHLRLQHMTALSHVWKCNNWNEFCILHKRQPQSSSFQNLTTITLTGCKSIKYLFSPLMVKFLTNLKKVDIEFCDGMEQVVSNEDDEKMTTTTSTLFPCLGFLRLFCMSNLKHIGGGVAKSTTKASHGQSQFSQVDDVSWSLCQYSTEIDIYRCTSLSSVIPYYVAGRMQKLQVLSIIDCGSVMEVFETKEINNNNVSSSSSNIDPRSIVTTPRSIHITHLLPNLKILTVDGCERLENIFTLSTLESLKNLETLTITNCVAIKVIVREEYGEQTNASSKDLVFPHLKSIKLNSLPNLVSFFLGSHIDIHWPLLDDVVINFCPRMIDFTSTRSVAPKLKYLYTELGKHVQQDLQTQSTSLERMSSHPVVSKTRPWSYHNLVECNLIFYFRRIIFPSNEFQQLQKLETIHVKSCVNVEEVFEVAMEVTNNESQTIVKFPKLRQVELNSLCNLKCIWKNTRWRILEFPNLTKLSIAGCERLEHVFTCSMVGCVMQLHELHIQSCRNMKAIVKEEEDCDSEIKFPGLKSLKLEYLARLEGFCLQKKDVTFSSLDALVIKECARINVFTAGRTIAPILKVVDTSFGSFNVEEDVNTFIVTKKKEGFGSCSSEDE